MASKVPKKTSATGAPIIEDARFKSLHSDPRFARKPTKDAKGVDERFAAVLEDPRFSDVTVNRRKRPRGDAGDVAEAAASAGRPEKKARHSKQQPPKEEPAAHSDAESDDGVNEANEKKVKATKKASHRETVDERIARLTRMSRGEALSDEEYSDSDSDSAAVDNSDSSDTDADTEEEVVRAEHDLNADVNVVIDPEAPDLDQVEYSPDGSETNTLAAVNLDWDNIRAVDIMAVLQSFAPNGGSITRVTIYPSDYGLKKMAEEAKFGPTPLFGKKKEHDNAASGHTAANGKPTSSKKAASDEEDDEDDEDESGANGTNGEFDPVRLRAYELNKMKYYYAVIECNSVDTAIQIYAQCDGMEYEATSNVFDLRFVPEGTDFTNEPKDIATKVPDDYEPSEFITAALQSSNVELTWDADDPKRSRALNWEKLASRLGKGDEDEGDEDKLADVKAYLASSESEDDSEDEADDEVIEDDGSGADGEVAAVRSVSSRMSKAERVAADRTRMRALLLGGDKLDKKKKKKASRDDEASSESDSEVLQISFTPGLGKDIITNKKKREAEAKETTWEAYQRKKKEKKKAKKAARKAGREEDGHSGDDDHIVTDARAAAQLDDDDFFIGGTSEQKESKVVSKSGKSKRKGAAKDGSEDEKQKAELELLMMGGDDSGDDGTGRNYDLKALLKQQKQADKKSKKASKSKKGAAQAAEEAPLPEGSFEVDAGDARFAAALSRPEFGIDPTAPEFKNTSGMRKIMDSKRSTKPEVSKGKRPMVVTAGGAAPAPAAESPEDNSDVKALADVVKAKFKVTGPSAPRLGGSKPKPETKKDGSVQITGASALAALLKKK